MTDQTAEIAHLRGERKVLADLLREALTVISGIQPFGAKEETELDDLCHKIESALDAIALT